jgi:hypothetical protein
MFSREDTFGEDTFGLDAPWSVVIPKIDLKDKKACRARIERLRRRQIRADWVGGLALISQICIEVGLGSLLGTSTSIVKSQLPHQYMASGFRGRDVIIIE